MNAKAYVDGSYNAATRVYGAGAVLFLGGDNKPILLSQSGNHPAFVNSRNVAGEVMAAILVIEACKRIPGLGELTIYYDYAGIECWANGNWRANTVLSREYRDAVRSLPFKISFRKVKAHSGDLNNEKADRLAKEACGL